MSKENYNFEQERKTLALRIAHEVRNPVLTIEQKKQLIDEIQSTLNATVQTLIGSN